MWDLKPSILPHAMDDTQKIIYKMDRI